MENNNKLICKNCLQEKDKDTDFKPKRRVCRKCISKQDSIRYKHIIQKYYINHQDEICKRNLDYYYKKKLENENEPKPIKKLGRPRKINV